jgi:HK97 gp10 family phage protein
VKALVKVEGLAALDAKLGELGLSTGKNVLRRTGRYALEVMDEAWRARAPRLTGQLEESGGVGSKLTRSQRKARERESFVEVFAGPGPNPQAIQQEFGNVNQPAQPFMRPAWDATKDQVLERVKEGLGAEIDKAAKRQARKAAKAAAAGGDE